MVKINIDTSLTGWFKEHEMEINNLQKVHAQLAYERAERETKAAAKNPQFFHIYVLCDTQDRARELLVERQNKLKKAGHRCCNARYDDKLMLFVDNLTLYHFVPVTKLDKSWDPACANTWELDHTCRNVNPTKVLNFISKLEDVRGY